jgi:hypothetical protein
MTSTTDTAVVDHGKANAASAGYRSRHVSQNLLRGAHASRANKPENRGAFCTVPDKPKTSASICICLAPRGGLIHPPESQSDQRCITLC